MVDRINLLIVDDEVHFLDSLAQRLELRGFNVTKSDSGESAIESARKENFELVLLDLKMPGLGGKEVLDILKKEHKFMEVIILTGHGSLESAVECTKLGAFGYLPKPYEFENLIEILKNAYEALLKKKFKNDDKKLEQLLNITAEGNALEMLKEMRKLDN
ncbi:MAG: response regulator [Bacteroidota bacterium]